MTYAFKVTLLVVLTAILASSSATASGEGNRTSAFSVISDSEKHLLEPTFNSVYFKKGLPRRHLRHRLVRIDTEELRSQLQKDWEAKEAGEATLGVRIPLFDDLIVSVKVDQMIRPDFHGMTAYLGRLATDRIGTGSFSSFFTDDGQLKAVVHTDDASYLIEYVRDFDHYVVLAQKPLDLDFD